MINLRDMEIRHLIALDAVATEGTFSKAATRLGYTQSAVSQQIAALERIIGESVFDRPGGPRPVELTPLGSQVLAAGQALLARVDAMSLDLEMFRTGSVGQLSVGTFQSVSSTLLPRLVRRVRDTYPSLPSTRCARRSPIAASRSRGERTGPCRPPPVASSRSPATSARNSRPRSPARSDVRMLVVSARASVVLRVDLLLIRK